MSRTSSPQACLTYSSTCVCVCVCVYVCVSAVIELSPFLFWGLQSLSLCCIPGAGNSCIHKFQALSCPDDRLFLQEQRPGVVDASAELPYELLTGLDDLDVASLNAFLDSMDSEGRPEWATPPHLVATPSYSGGHHLAQQWAPPHVAVASMTHSSGDHNAQQWAPQHASVGPNSDSGGHPPAQQWAPPHSAIAIGSHSSCHS